MRPLMNPAETAGVIVGAAAAGLVAHVILFAVLHRVVDRSRLTIERSLVEKLELPARFALPLLGAELAIGAIGLPDPTGTILVHAIGAVLAIALAWLVVRSTYVLDDIILDRYQMDVANNLRSRRVRTQIQVLRRITVVVVTVVTLAVILLSFPEVRAAGAGLLASAGVVGIIAGVAARPTATNVIAGLQIALSQPIRVDDVVVVQTQWGRIEEIALTYVIVRIWDLRRLVLPISYFVEQPFENWTRSTADIMGWVFIQVDYAAPVQELRRAFEQIIAGSSNWDGKVGVLQVTTLGTETMQLRALMSSADSSRSWDLQCEVREQMIAYIQQHCPWALPHLRVRSFGRDGRDGRDGGAGEGPPLARALGEDGEDPR
ncbi:MAG: mechanosensitive ion channel family protein [Acidimicrobiales bacterium]